jgi:hypothetical protein
MKLYFLALGTVVVVCVGCAMDGHQTPQQSTGLGAPNLGGLNHYGGNKGEYHAPPPGMMMRPGPMVDGPGPGVLPMLGGPVGPGGPGGLARTFAPTSTQIMFKGPEGVRIGWQIPTGFAENQLITPARYNFIQGATYQLKLSGIPGREGLVIYPSLQVYPSHPITDAYLSHNAVPVELTQEDLDQVQSNNFVTKVIYLPDAAYQELAIANVETLVSTKLDPGVDPIQAADKRGTIMAVLRVGNLEREMPAQLGGKPMVSGENGDIDQVSHQVDGQRGEIVPPMPIGPAGNGGGPGIPGAIMVPGSGYPGVPIAGGNVEAWGMPITGTPIGLAGPPHLPYGGPAGLKSHTVRNRTRMDLPKPVDHMLIDVQHQPGLSLPEPVRYIQYTEKHPVYQPGELSNPAWNAQGQGQGQDQGQYCPPGQ